MMDIILEDLTKKLKQDCQKACQRFFNLCEAADIPQADAAASLGAALIEAAARSLCVFTSMPSAEAGKMFAKTLDAIRADQREAEANETE
jgi:hypothetical protein